MFIVDSQGQDKIVNKNQRNDMGGLSFLQSMSDIVRSREDKDYVHPIEKRKLNEKSLEMCTESLGTETGSESGDELLSLLAFEATTTLPMVPLSKPQEKDTNLLMKKLTTSRDNSFPPPIEFVKGSKYNRIVRFLGDDGRLVVQAIKGTSPPRCIVSERCEGRLRLKLSPESSLLSYNHEKEEEDNTEKLKGKNGNKKLSRLSRRCKENGREPKPMLTWKQQQFWVVT